MIDLCVAICFEALYQSQLGAHPGLTRPVFAGVVSPRRNYYVSAIDGDRRYLVAGPYDTHAEALDRVGAVRTHAEQRDPRAHFMAWGTAGSPDAHVTPLGVWSPRHAGAL